MLNGFFKQTFQALKHHQPTLEKMTFVISNATSLYLYPEFTKQYAQTHLSMFCHELSAEEKLSIEQDPFKKREIIEKSQAHLAYLLSRPD